MFSSTSSSHDTCDTYARRPRSESDPKGCGARSTHLDVEKVDAEKIRVEKIRAEEIRAEKISSMPPVPRASKLLWQPNYPQAFLVVKPKPIQDR